MADFHKCLAEFRELTKDVKGNKNATKKFNNLKEFQAYHARRSPTNPHYVKKTDKEYKKSDIPSKIPFKREENPKEWMKQYGWFRTHPEAKVYAPQPKGGAKGRGGRKQSSITKKITVRRCENPTEYDKQYRFFKKHPEAEVYDPTPDPRANANPLFTVRPSDDPVEYNRQASWLKLHKDENPDKIPPRQRLNFAQTN